MGHWQTFSQFFDFNEFVDGVIELFLVGVFSFLFIELLKRLDQDRPNAKNFKLVHRERPFWKKELTGEVALVLFNRLISAPVAAVLAFVMVDFFLAPNVGGRLFDHHIQQWPFWLQLLIALFVVDLSLYIRHRFVHHFFWHYHIIHHSTREITWITWLKLHPLDGIVMGLIDVLVMYFLGFGGIAIGAAGLIKGHYNRFCHSNLYFDWGFPLRYVFCSPNMHRWHHAADDPEAVNKNFAIIFAFIDLAFGTFYVPRERLPNHYGVWDEDGKDVVGTGFWEMLVYPFVHDWQRLKRLVGLERKVEPPPAPEDVATTEPSPTNVV